MPHRIINGIIEHTQRRHSKYIQKTELANNVYFMQNTDTLVQEIVKKCLSYTSKSEALV